MCPKQWTMHKHLHETNEEKQELQAEIEILTKRNESHDNENEKLKGELKASSNLLNK